MNKTCVQKDVGDNDPVHAKYESMGSHSDLDFADDDWIATNVVPLSAHFTLLRNSTRPFPGCLRACMHILGV